MTYKLALALVASTALFGCKKDDKGQGKPDPQKTDNGQATKPTEPAAKPASAGDAARAIMDKYEACRAKLAADDSALSDCAGEIAAAARAGEAALTDTAKKAAADIAAAADALAKTAGDDIEKLRLGFGEVSKPVETLLTSTPEVAAKYKMYECPMAKGFKRWAQPDMGADHAMANPYMGKKMLQCGSEVHDHHSGMSGGGDKDLLAAEMKAHEAAKPILEKRCASCHTKGGDGPKKAKKKALEHFAMDSYPYTGHHAAELGTEIREVLGVGSDKATMPGDDPGSVKGAELEAIVAWSKAWDAAAAAKVGHHGEMGHGDGHMKH